MENSFAKQRTLNTVRTIKFQTVLCYFNSKKKNIYYQRVSTKRKSFTSSTYNKLLLYKQILKPIWTYGIQLLGCTKKINVQIIQTFQNKVLRNIINAPWYIRNTNIHRNLKVDMIDTVIKKFAVSHEHRIQQHVNIETIQLLDTTDSICRLKRTKPHKLAWS